MQFTNTFPYRMLMFSEKACSNNSMPQEQEILKYF